MASMCLACMHLSEIFVGGLHGLFCNQDYEHHAHARAQVTTGEEGFFDVDSGQQDADPYGVPSNIVEAGRYWCGFPCSDVLACKAHVVACMPRQFLIAACMRRAANVGQDYSTQSGLPCIDFGGLHLWPENWNTTVML